MKKFSEIIDYYYKDLNPIVKELEKKREDVKKRIINVSVIAFIVATVVFYAISGIDRGEINFDLLVGYGFILVAGYGFIKKFFSEDYVDEFKQKVIRPLIEYIDSNLKYTSKAYVPIGIFRKSRIVTDRIDRYSGNDYVSGVVDGVKIEFSDILAQKEENDSKGNSHYHTVFEGHFLRAEFPKHFIERAVVLPDFAEKTFGSIVGKFLQSNNFGRADLVKMDNPEFEKYFVVYATDQIEARYILSHSMMERIIRFRKKVGHDISISFVGGEMFVAVHYNKDTLEPAIYESLLNYKIAKEYIATLYFALGIVEELKLNKKLWSKR